MDNLKTLMDRHEYELVVKLTEGSKQMDYLFYRISALLALTRGEEAVECIRNNREILQGELSLLMKVHIEILCLLERFDEAYDELEYYKNLPYVSQEVEELIHDFPKMIRDEEKKAAGSKSLSDDEIKIRLKSDKQDVVLPAIDMVRGRDIQLFLNEFQNIMVRFPRQSIRSFALLLLVQKHVDKEFDFDHNGQVIKVNPSKLNPPFVGSEFNAFIKRLQNEIKNPAVSEDAIQILSSYIIYIYPENISAQDDVLIEALRSISNEYLKVDETKTLEERCQEKNIDLGETEKLIQRIKECLDSF